jgi:diaminohydroxyphosphoribosylaminopyrimidine deaminase / 5-amino-6-(5-phosphoribosylamino)uracil reductase
VHRWRGQVDAVCVGIGTVLADDPLLTARTPEVTRQPARIVFDSEARLPPDSQLARTAHDARLIVVTSRAAGRSQVDTLRAAGAEVVVSSGGNEAERVTDALDKLGALGIQSVLLEGGPRLAGSFLDAGEVDEMRIFIAPIAVGGRAARVSVEGEGSDSIEHARQAHSLDVQMSGDDILLCARLEEW